MAIKFSSKKPQSSVNPSGIDHNSLLNKGTKTHAELDALYSEIETARGGKPSLLSKLTDIINSIVKKHSDLQGSGTTTHDNLDTMYSDYENAKGIEQSLADRLNNMSTAKKHGDLQDSGTVPHEDLDEMYGELSDAKGVYPTLLEKLDSLKPTLKLSELEDVDVTSIKKGQTIIWDDTSQVFKPGNSSSDGGGSATKITYDMTMEYNPDGTVSKEIYTGSVARIVTYKYDNDQKVTEKKVDYPDGSSAIFTVQYDASGNVTTVKDTGTEELQVLKAYTITQNQTIVTPDADFMNILNGYRDLVNKLQDNLMDMSKSVIKMQFKYDISLNLVKNYCNDYFIDVLQDDSNVELYDGTAFDSFTETIK